MTMGRLERGEKWLFRRMRVDNTNPSLKLEYSKNLIQVPCPQGMIKSSSENYKTSWKDLTKDATAKSLQSCLTLCNPIDSRPPGSAVPGILQARTLEWVAISFSSARNWKVKVKSLSCAWHLAIPWTTAYPAPPSMGFSRQEYWSGVPLPSPNKGWFLPKSMKYS